MRFADVTARVTPEFLSGGSDNVRVLPYGDLPSVTVPLLYLSRGGPVVTERTSIDESGERTVASRRDSLAARGDPTAAARLGINLC
jgi:hypothetical protein